MITAFTIPKPFIGHSNIIQRNALKSWKASGISDIFVFGDDEGVADVAKEYGAHHVPNVEKNEFGTPLLSSSFSTVQQIAKSNVIMYVNTDIIFFPQLLKAVQKISMPCFLLSGRRWDLEIKHEIDFSGTAWVDELQRKVENEGKLHGFSGKDYFVFTRRSVNMPAFAVGRPGWDDWLIYDRRIKGIPVIDATKAITVVHQKHDYTHSKFGELKKVGGPELKKNVELAGGLANMMTLRNADWMLDNTGLRRPKFPLRIYSVLSLCLPWRLLLGIIRRIRHPECL